MSLTTDPNDSRIKRGGPDETPVPQNEVYLVLSKEELAKGFVRPVRQKYKHVGQRPKFALRDLTPEEKAQFPHFSKWEQYPESERPLIGRYWADADLKPGCGTVTTMGLWLAETYARNPKFYGATYCCGCSKHLAVAEFVWEPDGSIVGS